MSKESPFKALFSFYDFGEFMCEGIFLSKGLDIIRNYPKDFKFDLVLNDYTCGPCLLGLLPRFNYPPLIGISAFNNPPNTDIIGGDKLGLTSKPFYSLNYDVDMNLLERFHNGFLYFFDAIYRKYVAIPALDKQIKKIFGPQTPYADELDQKSVLMLVNSDPSVDFPESLPPNVIQVGGLQIKKPKKLSEDIESFLKKGKKGSVLMSLGTNIRSDEIGEENIRMVVETFRKLPEYNFLWKFETSEMLKELPANVKIVDWLPQNDILASSYTKLFITHGGLLSCHESIWNNVPMVGIPFLADQHRNMYKLTNTNVAVKVDFYTMTEKKLYDAIKKVLEDPQYKRNMEIRSKRFRDQPELPLDRAIWWSEYVIRNPKPDHLQSSRFNLGLLGCHYWDMQIISLFVLFLFYYAMKIMIRNLIPTKKIIVDAKKKKN